eukprot:TRINITY_DN16725_c0_g1_i1.p1 TRINITY_DN16725_c0_g1~~TRINITY_DN16725_c0_g1_i1.p1  ORF type:complete len:141 (-),score=17.31 TRINITY_DN16725_c0_g1_i1:24-413(-)
MSEGLPPRTVSYKFPKVPDFTDPDYDKSNPAHFVNARDQRVREYFVGYAYMLRLQESLRTCYLQNGINAKRVCHEQGAEYMRRLSCPNYTCPEDAGYLEPAPLVNYRISDPDPSLEMNWQNNKIPGMEQ